MWKKQCSKGGYFHIFSLEQPEQQIFHPSQAAALWTMSCSHTDTNTTDLQCINGIKIVYLHLQNYKSKCE